MEINKQLFEDVLSGKLKGTFVLRIGKRFNSKHCHRNINTYRASHPYCIRCDDYCFSYTPDGMYLFTKECECDIVDFIPEINMKENELTIEIPSDKIVDWEESKKQNKIVLKDKQLAYRDICTKLLGNNFYFIDSNRSILNGTCGYTPNCAPTKHQLECILAKNKLANVAKYLNNGWKPGSFIFGWFICVCGKELEIRDRNDYKFNNNIIFKSKELAQQAIEVLGEETVKLALEPLGI